MSTTDMFNPDLNSCDQRPMSLVTMLNAAVLLLMYQQVARSFTSVHVLLPLNGRTLSVLDLHQLCEYVLCFMRWSCCKREPWTELATAKAILDSKMKALLQTRAVVTLLLLLLGVREMTPSPVEDDLDYEGVKARFVRQREDEDEGGERVRRSLYAQLMDLRLPLRDLTWYKKEHELNGITTNNPFNVNKRVLMIKARESLEVAHSQLLEREKLEQDLQKRNLSLAKGSPGEIFQSSFKKSHLFAVQAGSQGSLFVLATKELKKRLNLSNEFVTFDLPLQETLSITNEFCNKTKTREVPADCEAYRRYRSIDGTCNNFNNPLWGATMTPLLRYLPPFYDDDDDDDEDDTTNKK
ncbi:uncharacterized protein LOC134772292 [Penaeus indicus]|uniref:uncharacterized protein LOC134772292 n=1 Tax=Penaeus indicus TaxID=29960 RepID=UPI00300C8C8D